MRKKFPQLFGHFKESYYFCSMIKNEDFLTDEIYGERLLISVRADQTELNDNIRVARVLLRCFDDMYIRINEHLLVIGHKIRIIPSTGNWATEKAWKARMG